MARDSAIPLRKALLKHLKADAAITALVPAPRIYPPQRPPTPDWPFILYGALIDVPFRGSGLDGQTVSGAIHAFAKGHEEAETIKAALQKSLDHAELDLSDADYTARASIIVTGGRTIADGDEGDSWHGIADIEVSISS